MTEQKNIWMIILMILLITLVVEGGIFLWQQSNPQSQKESLLQQNTPDENQIPTEQSVPAVNTPTTQPEVITYKDPTYGFTLKFPQTWKNFTTKKRTIDPSEVGTMYSIDFGFSTQDSLFNISLLTKDEWKNIQQSSETEGGPVPGYLGENTQYVFVTETAQDAANATIVERMKEIESILKTFSLN